MSFHHYILVSEVYPSTINANPAVYTLRRVLESSEAEQVELQSQQLRPKNEREKRSDLRVVSVREWKVFHKDYESKSTVLVTCHGA